MLDDHQVNCTSGQVVFYDEAGNIYEMVPHCIQCIEEPRKGGSLQVFIEKHSS